MKRYFKSAVFLVFWLTCSANLVAAPLESGPATIYVHRAGSFFEVFTKSDIVWNGDLIYRLPRDTSLTFICQPGEYTIRSENKKKVLTFKAQSEKVYHIQIKFGFTGFYPVMMEDAKAIAEFNTLKEKRIDLKAVLSTPKPPWWKTIISKTFFYGGSLILGLGLCFLFQLAVNMCQHHFGDAWWIIMLLFCVIGLAAAAVLSLIPYAYISQWVPKGLQMIHVVSVLLLALLISLLMVLYIDPYNPVRQILYLFPVAGLVIFFVSLGLIVGLNRFFPETIGQMIAMDLWKVIGLAVSIVTAIIMNIYLFIVLGKSRDLSGAYESSDTGYWATRDGKYFMGAKKWQTGEWRPPLSAFMRYFILNLVIAVGLFLFMVYLQTGLLNMYFLYLGLIFLACFFFTAKT